VKLVAIYGYGNGYCPGYGRPEKMNESRQSLDEHKDLSERKGFRGLGLPVIGADWMPGAARAPVSLSYYNDEA